YAVPSVVTRPEDDLYARHLAASAHVNDPYRNALFRRNLNYSQMSEEQLKDFRTAFRTYLAKPNGPKFEASITSKTVSNEDEEKQRLARQALRVASDVERRKQTDTQNRDRRLAEQKERAERTAAELAFAREERRARKRMLLR